MNVSNNLISVIIPAFNHELYIATTIKSIIAQSYNNIELLIINDGSTDRTWDVIQSFSKKCENRFVRVVFETQNHLGKCETLNKLLRLAQGEYVYIISSDDLAKPQALETLHDFLEQNKDYALVVGDNEYIDDKGKTLMMSNLYNPDIPNGVTYNTFGTYLRKNRPDVDFLSSDFGTFISLLLGNYIPNGYLIRKSIFDKTGYLTKEAPLENYYLMLQISLHSKLKYLDETLFSYRIHGKNTSDNREKMALMTIETLKCIKKELMNKESLLCECKDASPSLYDAVKFKIFFIQKIIEALLKITKNIHSCSCAEFLLTGNTNTSLQNNNLFSIKAYCIRKKFEYHYDNLIFDVSELDNQIKMLSEKIYDENIKKFLPAPAPADKKIALLATEFCDEGGHTSCAFSMVKSLHNDVNIHLFMSEKGLTLKHAPRTIKELQKYIETSYIEFNDKEFAAQLIEVYNGIITFNPSVIFVFIHPNDILMTAVISLIKKHTNIKIIYFNHASHFPNLGMNFADLVLEGMPTTQYVTENYRGIHKCHVFGLQSKAKEDNKYYSKDTFDQIRSVLGIPQDALLTMSGATASYKFFDGDESHYFKMIYGLLVAEKKLHHIVITNLTEEQKIIISKIFSQDQSVYHRLHIINRTPDFEILFQSADVFIDSFPVSAALTQIDLMRLKVPTVVKINKENALHSFHEYMPKNYPYMFETEKEMMAGIQDLLHNPQKRDKISQELYEYYLSHYEESVAKEKYLHIIKNKDNLEALYTKVDDKVVYNFKEIR